jgi:hypothetical protein
MSSRRAALAALALALGALAAPPARAHTFPPVRTVVVQVERCELALLVGYRAGTGDNADRLIARVASLPREKAAEAIRDLLAAQAMAPLAVTVDGKPLAPTAVHAKLPPSEAGAGTRPMVIVLVTYALPAGKALAVTSQDPRTTRFSWTDRESLRVPLADAPAQGRWFAGAAAFSLKLAPPPANACTAGGGGPTPSATR